MPELIPGGQISTGPAPPTPSGGLTDPLSSFAPGENVSINAVGVEVRTLLGALAEAAGLSLVIGPEVTGQITVNLVDIPALEAFRLVLQETGLMVAAPAFSSPYGPVVFYVLPVNIWEADAELLQARYRVSREMAEWIVESRLENSAERR